MPLSRGIARFNRTFLNRVTRPLSGRFGPATLVRHRGRKSGRAFETPVFAFREGDRMVFALTYGSGADWVQNVLAAGGCDITFRNQMLTLSGARLVTSDPGDQPLPTVVRAVLRRTGVNEFLVAGIVR